MKAYTCLIFLIFASFNVHAERISFDYFGQKENALADGVIFFTFHEANALFTAVNSHGKEIRLNDSKINHILSGLGNKVNVKFKKSIYSQNAKINTDKVYQVNLIEGLGYKYTPRKAKILRELVTSSYNNFFYNVVSYEIFSNPMVDDSIGILKEREGEKDVVSYINEIRDLPKRRIFLYRSIYRMLLCVFELHRMIQKPHYDIRPKNFLLDQYKNIRLNNIEYIKEDSFKYNESHAFYRSECENSENRENDGYLNDSFSLGISIWELIMNYGYVDSQSFKSQVNHKNITQRLPHMFEQSSEDFMSDASITSNRRDAITELEYSLEGKDLEKILLEMTVRYLVNPCVIRWKVNKVLEEYINGINKIFSEKERDLIYNYE